VNAVHGYVNQPGHRSCSNENESRVGINVSELLGGEVGISALVFVTAPDTDPGSHKNRANSEHNPSGNILHDEYCVQESSGRE